MSTIVAGLAAKLAELAVRNTASAVFTKVEALKQRSDAATREAELMEIINQLVTDRVELVTVAQGLEQELAGERMSNDDMEFISDTMIPKLREVLHKGQELENGKEDEPSTRDRGISAMAAQANQVEESLDVLDTLLDQKTFQVLQLIGFNFRRGIGEPMTETLRAWILMLSPQGLIAFSQGGQQQE